MPGFAPVGGAPIGAPLWVGGNNLDVILTDEVAFTDPLAVGLTVRLSDTLTLEDRTGDVYVTLTDGLGVQPVLGLGSTYVMDMLDTILFEAFFTQLDEALSDGIGFGSDAVSLTPHSINFQDTMRLLQDLVVARGYAVDLTDGVGAASALLGYYGMVLREPLKISNVLVDNQNLHIVLAETVATAAALRVGLPVALTAGVGVAQTALVQQALLMAEELGLTPNLAAQAIYHVALNSQLIRMRDSLARFFGADVVDALTLAPGLAVQAHFAAPLTDTIGVGLTVTPQFLLSVALSDDVELSPADIVRMLYNPSLVDDIEFSGGYLAPDGSLTTWSMNIRTGSVTEYDNYAFNSFARVGNRYLGASDSGLYELLGDDDDGEDIIAQIRSGFMQFGGTHLSRMKAAYIAARGEGDFVLRIETADGAIYDYATSTRNMRSTKVHMGKGQRARYFAFELVSSGQDFDLDSLEFVPIVVDRRV